MLSPRMIIQFVKKESLARIFLWMMGLGIFILLDTLSTIALAARIGAYLAVAMVGILTWAGLGIFFASMARHIRILRNTASKGSLPRAEFVHISALALGALLVIIPGFVTDLLGWLCYLPPVRMALGGLIYRRFEHEFEQVYQHLAIDDLSDRA